MLVPHLLKIYFGLGSLSSVLEIVSSQLPSRCITEVFTELKSAVRSELITKLPVLLGCRWHWQAGPMGGGLWNTLAPAWTGGGGQYPASKITDFGYTASYIRQASPELGGAPIIMTDVGPGGIVNCTHQELSYIRCSIYYY